MSSDQGPEDVPRHGGGEAQDDAGRRSRLLPLAVGLVALAGFLAIVWYAYTAGIGGDGGLPVVKAQSGPEKVRPEEPGGMDVPHRDKLVMNEASPQVETPQVERLLPPPETPKPPEPLKEPAETAEPQSAAAETAEPQAEVPEIGGEPTAEAPAPTETQQAAEPEPTAADEQSAAPKAEASQQPAEPSETQQPAAPEAKPAEAEPVEPEPAGAPGPKSVGQLAQAGGSYLIQLASLRSRAAAEREWERLIKKHPDLLGDGELTVQRAEIEGKGIYFRVQTGPFPNRATAEDMCAILKEAEQACLVVQR